MKKVYEQLKMSVVRLATADIICSSGEFVGNEETRYDVGGQWKSEWFN